MNDGYSATLSAVTNACRIAIHELSVIRYLEHLDVYRLNIIVAHNVLCFNSMKSSGALQHLHIFPVL